MTADLLAILVLLLIPALWAALGALFDPLAGRRDARPPREHGDGSRPDQPDPRHPEPDIRFLGFR